MTVAVWVIALCQVVQTVLSCHERRPKGLIRFRRRRDREPKQHPLRVTERA